MKKQQFRTYMRASARAMLVLGFAILPSIQSVGQQLPGQGRPTSARPTTITINDLLAEIGRRVPEFGGMFVDADKDTLYVYLVNGGRDVVPRLKKAMTDVLGANTPRESRIEVLTAQYSFVQLKEWHDKISMQVLAMPRTVLTAIDHTTNRLKVGVETLALESDIAAQLADLGVPREAVNIEEAPREEARTLLYRTRSRAADLQVARDPCATTDLTLPCRPLVGGIQISIAGPPMPPVPFSCKVAGTGPNALLVILEGTMVERGTCMVNDGVNPVLPRASTRYRVFEANGVTISDCVDITVTIPFHRGTVTVTSDPLVESCANANFAVDEEPEGSLFPVLLPGAPRPIAFFSDPPVGEQCTLGFAASRNGVSGFVTNSHCTNREGGINGPNEPTAFFQPAILDEGNFGIGTEKVDPCFWYPSANPPVFPSGCTKNPHGSPQPPPLWCPVGRACRLSDSAFASLGVGIGSDTGFIAQPTKLNPNPCTPRPILPLPPPTLPICDTGWNGADRFQIVDELGDKLIMPGEPVNKVGSSTGWTQGTVTIVCGNFKAGAPITFICQTEANLLSAEGDSGAPVFQCLDEKGKPIECAEDKRNPNVRLLGIMWGGPSGEPGVTDYSPIGKRGDPTVTGVQNAAHELGSLSKCSPGNGC